MSSPPKTAKEIFVAAIEAHSPEQWPAFLDQACYGDAQLRHRVEVLLEAHAEDNSLLDNPAVGSAPTLDAPIAESPGTIIGKYKLLQEIGEGGMGTVFMAQQTEPVKRRVAVKIIKPGMDSKQVIARFEAERQALAMMDHPNIAKVLDAGTTDSGRPYFAMELVKGIPITRYCDEHHLTPRERLKLFASVCWAVQHAHQKGVIHRDLKPSNVLVAHYDSQPVVKVIDFGVAKATGQQLTERTLFTEFGQVVGTLEYMSPEQARFNQLDIDTRSDIYSLGVLLYELLTGVTPFDRDRLKSAAFDEVMRIIREEEPPKPSTRVSIAGSASSMTAERCNTEPRKLFSLLRGDLDWLVMKALAKERERRYETASGLAADVERYLEGEPIEARPPSTAYRLSKTVVRHRVALATTAIVMLALLTGIGVSIWGWSVAVAQREAAIAAKEDAVEARKQAEEMLERWSKLQKAHVELVMEEILVASLLGEPDKARERLEESRSLPIPEGWHQVMEGQIRIVEGRYLEAIDKLEEAEQLLGKRTAINSMLALALAYLGQEDRSFRRFAALQEQQCHDFADYLFRGWALSERWAEEALEDLTKARQLRPASHVALMIYAQALRNLSDNLAKPSEALKQSEVVLDLLQCVEVYLGPHPRVQSEMVLAHLTAAGRCSEIADEQGRDEHLKEAQELAAALDTSSADARLARAHLFRQTGNWKQALRDFEAFPGRAHQHVSYSNLCAILFYRNHEHQKAMEIFDDFQRAETETGSYAFRLFALLDAASRIELQKECHAMFANRPRDQQTVQRYWDWTICRFLGESNLAEQAADGFVQGARAVKKEMWVNHGKFMKGEIGEEQLVTACRGRRFELAHAHFLVAIEYLAQGERVRAGESFQRVLDTNHCRVYVSWWSEVFLERLKDGEWLSWLPEPDESG